MYLRAPTHDGLTVELKDEANKCEFTVAQDGGPLRVILPKIVPKSKWLFSQDTDREISYRIFVTTPGPYDVTFECGPEDPSRMYGSIISGAVTPSGQRMVTSVNAARSVTFIGGLNCAGDMLQIEYIMKNGIWHVSGICRNEMGMICSMNADFAQKKAKAKRMADLEGKAMDYAKLFKYSPPTFCPIGNPEDHLFMMHWWEAADLTAHEERVNRIYSEMLETRQWIKDHLSEIVDVVRKDLELIKKRPILEETIPGLHIQYEGTRILKTDLEKIAWLDLFILYELYIHSHGRFHKEIERINAEIEDMKKHGDDALWDMLYQMRQSKAKEDV